MARSLVKNSANEKQRNYADRKEQRRQRQRAALIATQLSTYAGREFVWAELERHGIDDLVLGGPIDEVNRFLGKRNAGIELRTEIMTQHPDRYLEMQREAMDRVRRDDDEVDAVHTQQEQQTED